MSLTLVCILGAVFAIVATILAMIFIMPQSRVPKLNKFLYALHNIANFKSLLIEKIIKVLYVFSTCYVILAGFFMLFSWTKVSYFGYTASTHYNGGAGILLLIFGPILVRLIYEGLMMFIILVNNTIELRKHFCDADQGSEVHHAEKVEPNYVFCSQCGTRYNANAGNCPNGCENHTDKPAE